MEEREPSPSDSLGSGPLDFEDDTGYGFAQQFALDNHMEQARLFNADSPCSLHGEASSDDDLPDEQIPARLQHLPRLSSEEPNLPMLDDVVPIPQIANPLQIAQQARSAEKKSQPDEKGPAGQRPPQRPSQLPNADDSDDDDPYDAHREQWKKPYPPSQFAVGAGCSSSSYNTGGSYRPRHPDNNYNAGCSSSNGNGRYPIDHRNKRPPKTDRRDGVRFVSPIKKVPKRSANPSTGRKYIEEDEEQIMSEEQKKAKKAKELEEWKQREKERKELEKRLFRRTKYRLILPDPPSDPKMPPSRSVVVELLKEYGVDLVEECDLTILPELPVVILKPNVWYIQFVLKGKSSEMMKIKNSQRVVFPVDIEPGKELTRFQRMQGFSDDDFEEMCAYVYTRTMVLRLHEMYPTLTLRYRPVQIEILKRPGPKPAETNIYDWEAIRHLFYRRRFQQEAQNILDALVPEALHALETRWARQTGKPPPKKEEQVKAGGSRDGDLSLGKERLVNDARRSMVYQAAAPTKKEKDDATVVAEVVNRLVLKTAYRVDNDLH